MAHVAVLAVRRGPQAVDEVAQSPDGILEVLSKREMQHLLDKGQGGLYELFRRCCLAVLNCGAETDDRPMSHRNDNRDERPPPRQE